MLTGRFFIIVFIYLIIHSKLFTFLLAQRIFFVTLLFCYCVFNYTLSLTTNSVYERNSISRRLWNPPLPNY